MAKGSKKVDSTDNIANVILNYLEVQNRPYSATDLQNNLHNQFSKTQITKALTQLVADETIICKIYGKQSVYVIRQDSKENAPTQKELNDYDEQIQQLREDVIGFKEKHKSLSHQLSILQQSMTLDEIKEALQDVETHNQKMKEKLEKLKDGAVLIDIEEKKSLDKEIAEKQKECKKRRTWCMDIMDTICEGMGKKRQELMEEIGLENE